MLFSPLQRLPLPKAVKRALHFIVTSSTISPLQAPTTATGINTTAQRLLPGQPTPAIPQALQQPAAAVKKAAEDVQEHVARLARDDKVRPSGHSSLLQKLHLGHLPKHAAKQDVSSPHIQTAAEAMLSDVEATAAALQAAAAGGQGKAVSKAAAGKAGSHVQQLQELLQQEEQLRQLQAQLQGLVVQKLQAAKSLQARSWLALSQVTDALEAQQLPAELFKEQQQQPEHKHHLLHRHHKEAAEDAVVPLAEQDLRDSLLSSVAAALQLLQHSIEEDSAGVILEKAAESQPGGPHTAAAAGATAPRQHLSASGHAVEAAKSAARAVTESAAAVKGAAVETVDAGKAVAQGAASAVSGEACVRCCDRGSIQGYKCSRRHSRGSQERF